MATKMQVEQFLEKWPDDSTDILRSHTISVLILCFMQIFKMTTETGEKI